MPDAAYLEKVYDLAQHIQEDDETKPWEQARQEAILILALQGEGFGE